MDSYTNNPASLRPIRPLARYRVIARHHGQIQSLVTLAENARQAGILAKAFCDALDASGSRNGIISVRTQEWVGTLTEGEWQPISLWHGGFLHWFARESTNGDRRTSSRPRNGENVECVLLGDKTRKGGWKAKLLQRGTEGPITNTVDVPKSAKAGQAVTLRVGAISQDGTRIQFHWQAADNPECR